MDMTLASGAAPACSQPLPLFLQVVNGGVDGLGLRVRWLPVQVAAERLDALSQQAVRVVATPPDSQEPLTGQRQVPVPVGGVILMCVYDFLIQLSITKRDICRVTLYTKQRKSIAISTICTEKNFQVEKHSRSLSR